VADLMGPGPAVWGRVGGEQGERVQAGGQFGVCVWGGEMKL
jgi:hypothetical protein